MQWTWFIACLACVSPGFSNKHYHELSRRIFSTDPSNSGAFFGFSISTVHSGLKSKLVIGAPRADSTGKIYTCELNDNDNKCISNHRTNIARYEDKESYRDLPYWYGAKVMGTDDFFVGCAPLSLDKLSITANKDGRVGTYGQCYKDRDQNTAPEQLETLRGSEREENYTLFENMMDSFGWSLFVDPDGTILVGGPAVVRGRLLIYPPDAKKGNYINGEKSNNKQFNFGYAVTTGRFILTSYKVVAVSSTFGFGEISFYPLNPSSGTKKKKTKKVTYTIGGRSSISGFSLGSMFGAALCSAYLQPETAKESERPTDLLVGAPAFADKDGYNVGAVYIFNGTKSYAMEVPLFHKKIDGYSTGSYFGSSIISVGDLNNDDSDEIAIAAPYEVDGRGTVYLYSGADLMKKGDIKPIQTIVPESKLSLKEFGYSLTAVRDYDDNGCNELAIGAPESNKVMVLRCIAAITIKLHKLKERISSTAGKDSNETLDVCLTASFANKPAVVEADIQVNVNIEHNDATLSNSKRANVTIKVLRKDATKNTGEYCNTVTLVKHGSTGDYNKEIMYDLKASLQNSLVNKTDLQSSDVILNEHSQLEEAGSIWVQECGMQKCVPDLHMNVSFSTKSPYEIGSSQSINVTVSVLNQGNVSYDGCVRVRIVGARVPRPPDVCIVDESRNYQLLCTPRQLLRKDMPPWIIETISVDTTQFTNENNHVGITVELYNECNSTVTEDKSEVFKLFADPEHIVINRQTNDGELRSNLVNLTRSDIKAQKAIVHIYTISNDGPTTWVNLKIHMLVQKQDFVTTDVYIQEQLCQSEETTDSKETLKFSCLVPKLDSHGLIEAKVNMRAVADKLNDRIGKELLTVTSNITVYLGSIEKHANITNELRLVETNVPIWIIIVASILALILLVIIFLILRECGFLTRKDKEQLKQVRMSVRRQTVIMRQSMMNRPEALDQEGLVESNDISNPGTKRRKDRRVVINDF